MSYGTAMFPVHSGDIRQMVYSVPAMVILSSIRGPRKKDMLRLTNRTGQPVVGKRYFFKIIAQPGDLRFVDINGDTIFTDKDKTVIGNPNPKFTFAFTFNLEYKGFDLNCFFQGSYGNQIFNANKGGWYSSSSGKLGKRCC